MLGLRSPHLPPIFLSKSKPLLPTQNPNYLPSISTTNPKQFRIYAQNGSSDEKKNDGIPTGNGNDGKEEEEEEEKVKNGRPKLNLKWMDLVLDPDPDNIVAVGLTGLLTWASVQVLWQLIVISVAILLAAVKYTIVAALLIFILITLL